MAVALNGLAQVLCFLGDFPLARLAAERTVKINESVLGPHHPDMACSFFQLARVLQEQHKLGAAPSILERSRLAIDEASLGPNHAQVASTLHEMAFVLQLQGKLSTARPWLERALAIKEEAHGPQHRKVGAALNDVGPIIKSAI